MRKKIKKIAVILLTITVSFISLQNCEDDSVPSEPANAAPEQPFNETPNNGANDVELSLTLSWSCYDADGDSLVYDIYFSQNSNPELITENHDKLTYNLDSLKKSTVYYWKICAKDPSGGLSMGNVWSFTTSSFVCGSPITYHNKIYNTIKIGNQCWFKENLDVGLLISSDTAENQTNNGIIEKYCYNNDENNCNIYGGLYQWDEAMQYVTTEGSQGICPGGWHIPTKTEMQTLQTFVNDDVAKLIDTSQSTVTYQSQIFYVPTNETGFSALFAGYYTHIGVNPNSFTGLGAYGLSWISTQYGTQEACFMNLNRDNINIYFGQGDKVENLSIRCLKD